MKKTLALLLALALVFSSITVAFADEAISADAKASQTLGMLVGDGSGVTASYLATAPTRIQAAVMFLRLKGLENEAKAFTGVDNFADAEKAAWAKPIMAYLKANTNLGWAGTGNGNFDPNGKIDAKSYYKVMLETLGYKQNTTDVVGDFTWDNLLTFAAEKGLKAVAGTTSFTVDNLATATVEALKTNVKDSTKTLAASLVEAKVITAEKAIAAGVMAEKPALAVDSVTAKTASSFVVKFNTAVEDTTKVAISTKRNDSTVALTTTWNDAKTEATLTFAGLLPEGDYVVSVKVDNADFGTKTVAITKQKVAKIEILGTQLSVAPNKTVKDSDGKDVTKAGEGYVLYQVFDQYGVDITTKALSNSNLTFTTSVGTTEGSRDGKVKVTPFNNTFLTQFPTATVTILCAESAVSTTKSLTVSLAAGTLSDITLNSITNADNKQIKVNDTLSKFYIDYTALDVNGNPTKDKTMVGEGLLLVGENKDELTSSYPNLLKAKITTDPSDSNKSAIALEIQSDPPTLYTDTPVIITAMTRTGKSASITVTVKRGTILDRLVLLTPSVLVAEGDTDVVIPYEAYDQDGNILTKYDDIIYADKSGDSLTPYGDLKFTKNADGTLKITAGKTADGKTTFVKNVPTVLQVVTRNGKSSMITIRPDEKAYANDLRIDTTAVKQYMQISAVQSMDLTSYGNGGIEVLDQYGRVMNLKDATTYVEAKVTTGSTGIISIAAPGKAFKGNMIEVTAIKPGTATVEFKLFKPGDGTDPTATKTMSFVVVKDSDINGIKVSAINPLYANATATSDTAQVKAYGTKVAVNGTLKNGGIVALKDEPAQSITRYVDNTVNFMIDGKNVRAYKLANNVTEATAKVTASTVIDGNVYTSTVDVKATNTTPTVTSVGLDCNEYETDVAEDSASTGYRVDGDTIYADSTGMASLASKSLLQYNSTGSLTSGDLYFWAKDSYGKKGMSLGLVIANQYDKNNVKITSYAIDSLGRLTGPANTGDQIVITAVAANGLSKTIKIVVE